MTQNPSKKDAQGYSKSKSGRIKKIADTFYYAMVVNKDPYRATDGMTNSLEELKSGRQLGRTLYDETFYLKERKNIKHNPIAVYNPPSTAMRLLYARAFIPKVFGTKTTGEHKGEKFVHDFKTEVKIYGLPKGGLLIQSLDGSRLWADERDLDKFERR